MKQHKLGSIVLGVNIVIVLFIILFSVVQNFKTCTIDINVAPIDASIKIGGKQYKNFELIKVFPGRYHVDISMDGMQSKGIDLDLSNGDYIKIQEYLLDEKGEFKYYYSHPEDVMVLEDMSNNSEVAQFLEEYKKITSIFDILPYTYDKYSDDFTEYVWYRIERDYRDDCPKPVCLKVVDKAGNNKQAAIDKISELGFDVNNYEFNYEEDMYGS